MLPDSWNEGLFFEWIITKRLVTICIYTHHYLKDIALFLGHTKAKNFEWIKTFIFSFFFLGGLFLFCVCTSDKNIWKIAHNQPTLRCKWAFDGVEGLDKNRSCSNQGVTKQVLDAVVAAFRFMTVIYQTFLLVKPSTPNICASESHILRAEFQTFCFLFSKL